MKYFYTVEDVMKKLDRKRDFCYGIIRKLNKELEEKGFIVQPGRVPKKFFDERFYC